MTDRAAWNVSEAWCRQIWDRKIWACTGHETFTELDERVITLVFLLIFTHADYQTAIPN